jgi:hypothetical protein
MNKYTFILMVAAAALAVAGCKAPETIAKGISEKSIAISGAFSYGRAGLDQTTQTPELLSLFGWGDYVSVTPGTELFRMEESEDASIFNASAISKKRKIFFASGDKKRMDKVIESLTKEGAEK